MLEFWTNPLTVLSPKALCHYAAKSGVAGFNMLTPNKKTKYTVTRIEKQAQGDLAAQPAEASPQTPLALVRKPGHWARCPSHHHAAHSQGRLERAGLINPRALQNDSRQQLKEDQTVPRW